MQWDSERTMTVRLRHHSTLIDTWHQNRKRDAGLGREKVKKAKNMRPRRPSAPISTLEQEKRGKQAWAGEIMKVCERMRG